MSQVDALRMVEHVRTRLVDLALSENHFREEDIADAANAVWAGAGTEGGLVSELWVEGAYSGELSNDTLDTLCREGLLPERLHQHLSSREIFPCNQRLYTHQSESIREAGADFAERRALVITAGTGLGKTESFLLPMLIDLWSAAPRQANGGMRCLILYPMNALVTDQVDRIYRWLQGQDEVRVFHFTSETPEDVVRANRQGEALWDSCRARTRKEARGRETHQGRPIQEPPFSAVPDIVITNYSMLEYMLCRPQDQPFFGPDLRTIILDEAHLYTGTLACEIKMLLRRVRERSGVSASNILHIATSATLGGDEDDLQLFASELFSTNNLATKVIRGKHAQPSFDGVPSPAEKGMDIERLASLARRDMRTLDSSGNLITDDKDTVNYLYETVTFLTSERAARAGQDSHPSVPARFLFATLRNAPKVRELASILYEQGGNVTSLNTLSQRLFERDDHLAREATIALLRLTASARDRASDLPLVPHRLHFLVRGPEGLSVCLNNLCNAPEEQRLVQYGCLQPYGKSCRFCGHHLLPVHRCDNCGQIAVAGFEDLGEAILRPAYLAVQRQDVEFFLLREYDGLQLRVARIDPSNGEMLGANEPGITLWRAERQGPGGSQVCPTCKSEWRRDDETARHVCRPLVDGRQFALAVIAETTLHDLPVYPDQTKHWKPGLGRRLLCFSDSRAGAARLGPTLTLQHEIQVLRAAMARLADDFPPAEAAEYRRAQVERLEDLLRVEQPPAVRVQLTRDLERERHELRNAEAGMPFTDFANLLAERAEMAELLERGGAESHTPNFDQADWHANTVAVRRHACALVGNELRRPRKKEALLESTGLIELVYPGIADLQIPPALEVLLSTKVRTSLIPTWPSIVALILDTIRADGGVEWTNRDDSSCKWLDESPLQGRWITREVTGWNSRALVGRTPAQFRRWFLANVLRTAGCTEVDAERLSEAGLGALFEQLFEQALHSGLHWLRTEANHQVSETQAVPALQILMDALSVRKPSRIFQCPTTGTLWTHSALGWVPERGCVGSVAEVQPDTLDRDPRWGRARREYIDSPIFRMGLWAEEHSAQLNPSENKRLQELFKSGVRNILSSTTTMELGIDIGGLNGVLLSNVPPGPANHRQRAGRAGRRSDGSAVVVTYARDTEYERQVFLGFDEFLRRPLRRPTVTLNRPNLIRRHVNAALLSEFLRPHQGDQMGAMDAFGKMGDFCGERLPQKWRDGIKPAWPQRDQDRAIGFSDYLEANVDNMETLRWVRDLVAGTVLAAGLTEVAGWNQFLLEARTEFDRSVTGWREQLADLRTAWNEIPGNPREGVNNERRRANAIWYMAQGLCDQTVIAWLADRGFLPRYGFPINLQSLTVRSTAADRGAPRGDERYRLERSSMLALREYVPDAQVLAGNRVITSRGLRKDWIDANRDQALGLTYMALTCPDEHVYISQNRNTLCPTCGAPPARPADHLVFPRFGFTTASWDSTPFGSRLENVGEPDFLPTAFVEGSQDETFEDLLGVSGLHAWYREHAEMLVRNRGTHGEGFAICHRCGYAESEVRLGEGRMNLPTGFAIHAPIWESNRNRRCWRNSEAPVLRNRALAARDTTNMLLLRWPVFVTDEALYSLGRALVLAGGRLLELDHRELGVEWRMRLSEDRRVLAIYDVAAGGAGHCLELLDNAREWLTLARQLLFIDEAHDDECDRACLKCILDFSAQRQTHLLNRRSALEVLNPIVAML